MNKLIIIFHLFSEEKLKVFIRDGFDPDLKCQYEALALKLQFNKLDLRIRQFMMLHRDQECPDIYEHIRMLREVNDVFIQWMKMNYGNLTGMKLNETQKMPTPRAKSTPQQPQPAGTVRGGQTFDIPRINVHHSTQPAPARLANQTYNVPSTSLSPNPPDGPHQRIYSAVQNLEKTLHSIQSPRLLPRVMKKKTRINMSKSYLPRRGLYF